jgi:hypothetical protein
MQPRTPRCADTPTHAGQVHVEAWPLAKQPGDLWNKKRPIGGRPRAHRDQGTVSTQWLSQPANRKRSFANDAAQVGCTFCRFH